LRGLPLTDDPNVLVATATADDAGVYRLSSETALVQTVDFFTPIVDDPYTFGAIAAANALSDVYAMGGTPITALAIAAFPEDMPPGTIGEILRGGTDKAREAGVSIIGGHTIKDNEPKYGLAVTGTVHPEKIWRNATASVGDAIVLTKRLGTGILTTARRADRIDDAALLEAIESMTTLNRDAAAALKDMHVHAVTDVTGFGLLGHLSEMLAPQALGADIDVALLPIFAGVRELVDAGIAPGGTRSNLQQALENGVAFADGVTETDRLIAADAQTSGGLLIALPEHHVAQYCARTFAVRIGTVTGSGTITCKRGS
jgi:selenide,water dikinase